MVDSTGATTIYNAAGVKLEAACDVNGFVSLQLVLNGTGANQVDFASTDVVNGNTIFGYGDGATSGAAPFALVANTGHEYVGNLYVRTSGGQTSVISYYAAGATTGLGGSCIAGGSAAVGS
jgi:hypothetical protein